MDLNLKWREFLYMTNTFETNYLLGDWGQANERLDKRGHCKHNIIFFGFQQYWINLEMASNEC